MIEQTKITDDITQECYIDRYMDGHLTGEEMEEFEMKCLEDKSFFQQVQERKQLREKVAKVIKESGKEIFSDYARESALQKTHASTNQIFITIFQTWQNLKPKWKYSLVPAGAIVIVFLFFLMQRNGYFRSNSELEQELGVRQLRSGVFEILSPKIGETIDTTIQFEWRTAMEGPFKVIILNDKAEESDAFLTRKKSYTYSNTLPPGLYYWKFLEDGDWIYTGKFFKKSN